jgi:hypothetical protein
MDKLLPSTWPNPEQSVGELVGSKKGRMGIHTNSCWRLKSQVEEPFKSILEQVGQELDQKDHFAPSSAPLGYDIFMIGKTPQQSKPYIMFYCRRKEPRERAIHAIKSGELLKEHPGLEVGHWRSPPDAPNVQPLTQDDPRLGPAPLFSTQSYQLTRTDTEEGAEGPSNDSLRSKPLGLLVQLRGRNLSDMERLATAALSFRHAGQLYLLTTAHAFTPPDEVAPESGTEDADDDDDEWVLSETQELPLEDDFLAGHVLDREERLVATTSCGSLTPPADLSADSWTDMDLDRSSAGLGTEPRPDEDKVSPPTLFAPPPSRQEEPTGKSQRDQNSSGTFNHCALVNTSLDYALLAVSPGLAHHFRDLGTDTVLDIGASSTEVATMNQAGMLKFGVLENRPTNIRLPYGESFELVFPVRLRGVPEKGDSGAAVFERTSGKILGHIVVASLEASTVYIIPATRVLADIQARKDIISPAEISKELAIPPTQQIDSSAHPDGLDLTSTPVASDSGSTSGRPAVLLPTTASQDIKPDQSQPPRPSKGSGLGGDSRVERIIEMVQREGQATPYKNANQNFIREGQPTRNQARQDTGDASSNDRASAMITHFCEFAGGNMFDSVRAKLHEVDALRETNADLKTAYDVLLNTFGEREAQKRIERQEHQQDLDSYKSRLNEADEANKRLREELAKVRAALADTTAQVDEQVERIQGLVVQAKGQDIAMERLWAVERKRDELGAQLAAMTEQNAATTSKLEEAEASLGVIRVYTMCLRPIRDEKNSM